MTSNQIAYWQLKETQRANQAKEAENIRHNQADEYGKLIKAVNNPFSLGAHFAGGSNNLSEGTKRIADNVLNVLFPFRGWKSEQQKAMEAENAKFAKKLNEKEE